MKAILVIEMPKDCYECNMSVLAGESHTGQMCFRCVNHPTIMVLTKEKTRPDWCPLRELPQKKDYEVLKAGARGYGKTQNMLSNAHINGYNACIDEILGDKE